MSSNNNTTMPKEAREEWNGNESIEISFGATYVDNEKLKEVVPGEYSLKTSKDVIIIPAESYDKSKTENGEISYTAAMENMSIDDAQK
jgi:hypothetical protein